MKRKILFVVLFAFTTSLMAQLTAFVPYESGYFVKDGKEWTEYRPADKTGVWSKYKQYKEDDLFFYAKNKKCRLAIPKIGRDNIFIAKGKKDKWEVVYDPFEVYTMCPEKDALLYCYYDEDDYYNRCLNGYFVRDNNVWREYRPFLKRSVWAEFKQTGEDDIYFYLESTENKIYIPKNAEKDVIITKLNGGSWRAHYHIKGIYDRSVEYDYNFYFKSSANKKKGFVNKSARVSFDRKGKIQIVCNAKYWDLTYKAIEVTNYFGRDAIKIIIDEKSTLCLYPDGTCDVQCKMIGKDIKFADGDNSKVFKKVLDLLAEKSFYEQ